MDRYTKFILTVIAVGIIGINISIYGDFIVSPASASRLEAPQKIAICDAENYDQCIRIQYGTFKN